MPGIGELPGGITGCCAAPVGSTGATGGFVPGRRGRRATARRRRRRRGAGGGCAVRRPAAANRHGGGPVSAMLLCVPM